MTSIALPAVIKDARRRQRRRQLRIVALTLALFVALAAFLTAFRVDLSHGLQISFRQQATYQATETLSFTTASSSQQTGQMSQGAPTPFYAQLANSAIIRSSLIKHGPLNGNYNAAAVSTTSTASRRTCPPGNRKNCRLVPCPKLADFNSPTAIGYTAAVIELFARCGKPGTRHVFMPITWLPFMSINGTAHSPHQAITIAKRASAAFLNYLTAGQAPLPVAQRTVITPVSLPEHATLTQGRNFTLPYTLTGILLTLLAIAALTTLKPRQHL